MQLLDGGMPHSRIFIRREKVIILGYTVPSLHVISSFCFWSFAIFYCQILLKRLIWVLCLYWTLSLNIIILINLMKCPSLPLIITSDLTYFLFFLTLLDKRWYVALDSDILELISHSASIITRIGQECATFKVCLMIQNISCYVWRIIIYLFPFVINKLSENRNRRIIVNLSYCYIYTVFLSICDNYMLNHRLILFFGNVHRFIWKDTFNGHYITAALGFFFLDFLIQHSFDLEWVWLYPITK
jgi:hypothetical protein